MSASAAHQIKCRQQLTYDVCEENNHVFVVVCNGHVTRLQKNPNSTIIGLSALYSLSRQTLHEATMRPCTLRAGVKNKAHLYALYNPGGKNAVQY